MKIGKKWNLLVTLILVFLSESLNLITVKYSRSHVVKSDRILKDRKACLVASPGNIDFPGWGWVYGENDVVLEMPQEYIRGNAWVPCSVLAYHITNVKCDS